MGTTTQKLMSATIAAILICLTAQSALAQGGYFSVETLFLDRTNSSTNQILVQDNQTLNTLLESDQLDFDMNGGIRATLGLAMDDCKAIEMTYFGMQDWDETKVVYGNNNLRIPGNLALTAANFSDADRIQVDYSAHIDNAEFNLVATNCEWSLLGGVRYMSFSEFLRINSFDVATGSGDYITHTNNDLYGGQLGLRYETCMGAARFAATAKGGWFRNNASQQQNVTELNRGTVFRNSSGDGNEDSFVFECGANTSLLLAPNFWLRGGYNLMWVDGVALAPDQVDFNNGVNSGTGINTSGDAFFHGFNAGLEFRR